MKRCDHCDVELDPASTPPDYYAKSVTVQCQGGDHKVYDKEFDLCHPCMEKYEGMTRRFIEERAEC